MRRVLVLRPEPGASATVERARAFGLEAVATPLFEVEPVEWHVPDLRGFDGLLLTSANAVRYSGEQLQQLRSLRAYAVGEGTAQAAREAGFDVEAVGNSGVDGLLGSLEAGLKLLHLCGQHRREPMGEEQKITRVVAYRSKEIEAPDLASAAGSLALIHSPRAARRLAALVSDRGSMAIAAISAAAADATGTGWKSVDVAQWPSDDALLALAARLCNNPPPE